MSTNAKLLHGALPGFVLDGSGYGSGYGYGSGSGDGSGYGSGYGDGSGYGYGYGDGSGYGYGDGDGYWLEVLKSFSDLPRVKELENELVSLAFWKSNAAGKACNGGKSRKVARPGLVEEIAGPLKICTSKALHATTAPEKHQGDRLWVVALFGEVQVSDDKLGALKREIIAEVELS